MGERMESHEIAVRHIDRKILSLSSYKRQTKLKQWYWYCTEAEKGQSEKKVSNPTNFIKSRLVIFMESTDLC